MNARRYLWLTPILLAWVLAACGGSGSSGFDFAENVAIDDALGQERCVDFEGLMICPADSGTPPVADSPTPTPTFTFTPTLPPATPTATTAGVDSSAPTTVVPLKTRTPSPGPEQTVSSTKMPGGTPTPTNVPPPSPRTSTVRAADRTPTRRPTDAAPTATATAASILPPGVPTTLDGASEVECERLDGGCSFTFAFVPQGLPPTAAYRIAQRIGSQGP